MLVTDECVALFLIQVSTSDDLEETTRTVNEGNRLSSCVVFMNGVLCNPISLGCLYLAGELYPNYVKKIFFNGRCSVGTFVNFVWATMGRKFLSDHISAKEEDIEL